MGITGIQKGINYFKKFKDRLALATRLKESLRLRLEKGWNPITGTMPVDRVSAVVIEKPFHDQINV